MYNYDTLYLSDTHAVKSLVTSEYIVCVWSFALFKWGVTAYVYSMISFKYIKKVPRGFKPVSEVYDEKDDQDIDNDFAENEIDT